MIKRASLVILILLLSLSGVSVAKTEMKQVSLSAIDNLNINVGGAEIRFDERADGVSLSQKLIVDKEENTLSISAPKRNHMFGWFGRSKQNYRIIIGTKQSFSAVDINVGGAEIKGKLIAEKISINSGGLDLDTDLTAERIDINGGGMDINGRMEAQQLAINGAGMDVDLEVEKIEKIELNGVGMSAEIRYLDAWTGVRSLRISGIGGSLEVIVPAKNQEKESGKLDIKKDGLIDVEVKQY